MIETDTAVGAGIKLTCSRDELVETSSLVARAVSTRSAVQILAGILLRVSSGNAELSATDMEVSIKASLTADVESEGSVVVPGRVFLDAVRSLPVTGEKVEIEQASSEGMVEIRCGSASYRLNVYDAEDFPRLPELRRESAFKVDRAIFLETAIRVARAASHDESRPVLTGVLVQFETTADPKQRKLVMVATDSYRLAVKETPLTGTAPDLAAIVPARALAELGRIAQEGDEIELSLEENHAVFVTSRAMLATRRIDGQFPNYKQLIPETFAHSIKLPRLEFLDVVRRVAVMAQRTSPLRLRFEEGTLTVSAHTQDVGEAKESVPVAFTGEPLEIGFNAEFLREGVEAVAGDEIELNLINPLRPGLLRAEGDGFWYLIMPIRLAG